MSSIIDRVPGADPEILQEELNRAEREFIRKIKISSITYGGALVRCQQIHKKNVADAWRELKVDQIQARNKYKEGVINETKENRS